MDGALGDMHGMQVCVVNNDDLQEIDTLEESDLQLINTLQLDSRAPWTRVGAALSVDPVTAARRWYRLTASGAAWVTAHVGRGQSPQGCTAFVEVDCAAGAALEVGDTLARWPHVLTVEHTTGGRDLLLTVIVPSLGALSRFMVEAIGILPGVVRSRSQVVTTAYAVGGDWRLRALDPDQQACMGGNGRPHVRSTWSLTGTDRSIALALCRDGRSSLTQLARTTGTSLSTTRRRLGALLESNSVMLRCDVAQPLSGWAVSTWLWIEVPARDHAEVAGSLTGLPETRACFALTGGQAGLLYCAWLRSLADAQRLEQTLSARVPGLTVVDRAVVLRFVKRVGTLVDSKGRRIDVVPMDVWSDPVASARAAMRQ